MKTILFLMAGALPASILPASTLPIVVEAESGALGADWLVQTSGETTYITIADDGPGFNNPGTAARVASYEVTFPGAGDYVLYARMRVGTNTFNDDSFFAGNGFGEMDPAETGDWIIINNFAGAVGYTDAGDWVLNGGTAASNVWKWVRVTGFDGGASLVLEVSEDALTRTFEIGGREDGLDFDKLAFGRSDVFFTVNHLDNGLAGTTEDPVGEPFVPVGPPLATGTGKFLGSAHSNSQTLHFEQYWNQVTSENGSKWGSVEGQRDVMNWGSADQAYNLARDNGFPFRWHVLVWGNQQPAWMENLSSEEQLEEIREWFGAVAERYPDVDWVEVVNEPLHDPPTPGNGGYIAALGGTGQTGWDWVLNAFRIAREYFPDTPLMINEYNILSSDSNTDRYIEIIELLLEEDLIDVIGVQGHAFSTGGSADAMVARLDRLASTGLPIQVTEMDVDGAGANGDQVQLQNYQRIFPALWEHPAVMGITLWGYRVGLWRTQQGAYLVRDDGTERPALEWLRAYFSENGFEPYLGFEPMHDGNYIDTGDWLGILYIAHRPWVWSDRLNGWLWIAEESFTDSGAWVYPAK